MLSAKMSSMHWNHKSVSLLLLTALTMLPVTELASSCWAASAGTSTPAVPGRRRPLTSSWTTPSSRWIPPASASEWTGMMMMDFFCQFWIGRGVVRAVGFLTPGNADQSLTVNECCLFSAGEPLLTTWWPMTRPHLETSWVSFIIYKLWVVQNHLQYSAFL